MSKLLVFFTIVFFQQFGNAQISDYSELKNLFSVFESIYETELKKNGAELVFNTPIEGFKDFWWKQEPPRASVVIDENHDKTVFRIYVFGGLARLKSMDLDGISITICHEFGHLFGGAPFKDSGITTEGQSDFYSTSNCLEKIFNKTKPGSRRSNTPKEIDVCMKTYTDEQKQSFCLRALLAMDGHLSMLRVLEPHLNLWDTDPSVTKKVNTSNRFYPIGECRVETNVNGILGLDRPSCWYSENSKSLWSDFRSQSQKHSKTRVLCDSLHQHSDLENMFQLLNNN